MRYRPILAIAAALALGLAGWSCSPGPGGAPKPAPKAEPAPTATETPSATPTAKDDDLVPLELNPQPPKGVCTPAPVPTGPHIEPPDIKRPPVMVPKGSKNLALKKPVTSSTKFFITGDLTLITDGDTDGSEGGYVELEPGKQWVRIDLGDAGRIYAIAVYHYSLQRRVYHDVVIQVSDDPDFIKDTKTVFNNDYDNSSGLGAGEDMEYVEDYRGRVIQALGVVGRYVRLWSNGHSSGDMNHYVEVQVYGKPAK